MSGEKSESDAAESDEADADEADADEGDADDSDDDSSEAEGPASEPGPRKKTVQSEKDGAGARSRSARSRVALWVAALALVLGLLGGGVYWVSRAKEPPVAVNAPARTSLEALPQGAMLIVTIDLKALRASPLAAPYLDGDRSVPGLGTIKQTCGFDPILSVDEITVGVPEAGESDFGIAALGSFTDDGILECASKVIAGRGGRPLASPIGSFRSVRDLDAPSSGEIASRPGGLLLLGGGGYLRSMVEAADGVVPSSAADARHGELRGALAGFETVRATMVLSDAQRATMADEIEKSGGRAPAALLGIRGAAVGLRLIDKQTSLLAIIRTEGTSQALSIAGLIEENKNDARTSIAAQVLGVAPLLDRILISVEGGDVRATLQASVSELEEVIQRAVQVRSLLDAKPNESPEPEPPPSASATSSAAPR